MDFNESRIKSIDRKVVFILILALLLLASLFVIIYDFRQAEDGRNSIVEDGLEREAVLDQGPELNDIFDMEFNRNDNKEVEESKPIEGGTCLIDGQIVQEGTIVSGTTCTLFEE